MRKYNNAPAKQLKIVFTDQPPLSAKKNLLGRVQDFIYLTLPHWFLIAGALILGGATGVAFGVGSVYEAFLACVDVAALSKQQALLAYALLIPTLVCGFVTWCAAYVMPMLKSLSSNNLRSQDPHMYDVYEMVSKVSKEIDLISSLSTKDKNSLIRQLLLKRLHVQVNFAKTASNRLMDSLDNAIANTKSQIPINPIQGNLVPEIAITPEVAATITALDATERSLQSKSSFVELNTNRPLDYTKLLRTYYEDKSHLFNDMWYKQCNSNIRMIQGDSSRSIKLHLVYLEQIKDVYNSMINYRNKLENVQHSGVLGDGNSIVDQCISQYAQETCDKWVRKDYNHYCSDLSQDGSKSLQKDIRIAKSAFYTSNPELEVSSMRNNLPSLIREFASANALLINSAGVAMGFLGAFNMLFMPFGGYSLQAGPMLLSILGLGWSAGVACAWFLTKKSIQSSFGMLLSNFTDPRFADSKNKKNSSSVLAKHRRNNGEAMWTWLSLPTNNILIIARDIMIVGFSLGSSLYNYAAGVKFAVVASSVFQLFKQPGSPNALLNLDGVLGSQFKNPPQFARVFGQVSAVATLFATSGLLWSVVKQPRRQQDTAKTSTFKSFLFYTMFSFAVLGQAYLQLINTFWPHGLPALLAGFGISTAYIEPITYALASTVIPGMLICAKLLSDSTQDLINWMLPDDEHALVVNKGATSKPVASSGFGFNSLLRVFGYGAKSPEDAPKPMTHGR